jgi:hypothetical protein
VLWLKSRLRESVGVRRAKSVFKRVNNNQGHPGGMAFCFA